jgi:hypothetical protein
MGGFREELAAGVKKAPDEPGLGWDLRVTGSPVTNRTVMDTRPSPQRAFFGQPAKCEAAHTSPRFPSLTSVSSTLSPGGKMAKELGIILAMAVIVVAITTWAAPPNPKSASTESIRSSEVIYRAQHLNLH